jgi:hypothetical protein
VCVIFLRRLFGSVAVDNRWDNHDPIFGVVNVKQRAGMFHNDCALLDNFSNEICRNATTCKKSATRHNRISSKKCLVGWTALILSGDHCSPTFGLAGPRSPPEFQDSVNERS